MLEYRDGTLRIRLPSGDIKAGDISAVKSIEFDSPRNARSNTDRGRDTGRESDIKKASDVVDNISRWKGKMIKISGYASTVSKPGMDNTNFTIILKCGLNVQMNRDAFERKYLEIKDLDRTFEYHYDDTRYEVNFSKLSDL